MPTKCARRLTAAVQSFGIAFLPGLEYFEKLPLPMFTRVRKARERLDRVIHRVIAGQTERVAHTIRRSDLVSMLLAARDPENPSAPGMSDQQIRDEAMTIFLAGHETTANAMAWTWHLLGSRTGRRSDAARGTRARARRARTPTVEDVPKLEFTRAIDRRIDAPLSAGLDDGPTRDRAAHHRRSHHRARRAGDRQPVDRASRPALVDRSRHVQSRSLVAGRAIRPKYAYFPFGGGSRICIGESFAWTEAILLLATIAQKWRSRRCTAPALEPRITLRPKGLSMRAQLTAEVTASRPKSPLPCCFFRRQQAHSARSEVTHAPLRAPDR